MTTNGSTPGKLPATPGSGPDAPLPGARMALALLLSINLFNYIDRQVLAAVEPSIRAEFFPDVEDAQTGEKKERIEGYTLMGLLSTAFLVTYMLAAPVFGWLANRVRRWVLVGIGVLIWSVASGGSGLAGFYLLMLLTRCF